MRNEIDSLRKYEINYDEQRFLTLTFDDLGKIVGDFLIDVKHQRSGSEWVKKTSAFNTRTFIANIINLYMNYRSTGEWNKQGGNHNKVLVDLATALKHEYENNKKIPGNPTSIVNKTPATCPVSSTGTPAWKFKNFGKTNTCSDTGAKYEWCKLHGR